MDILYFKELGNTKCRPESSLGVNLHVQFVVFSFGYFTSVLNCKAIVQLVPTANISPGRSSIQVSTELINMLYIYGRVGRGTPCVAQPFG